MHQLLVTYLLNAAWQIPLAAAGLLLWRGRRLRAAAKSNRRGSRIPRVPANSAA